MSSSTQTFAFISSPICCLQNPSFCNIKCCFIYIAYWLWRIDTTCSNDKLNIGLFASILYIGKHKSPLLLFLRPHIKMLLESKYKNSSYSELTVRELCLYSTLPKCFWHSKNRSLMLQYFSIHKLVIFHTECLGTFAISHPCRQQWPQSFVSHQNEIIT